MRSNVGTRVAILASLGLLACLSGCVCAGECAILTDMVSETKSVAPGEAERVDVVIDMSVGKVVLTGGAEELMEATFEYNVAEWRPEIKYTEAGDRGTLTVSQPDARGKRVPNGAKNRWTVALRNDLPLTITLDMGVGEAELLLGDLAVTELDVDQGVGQLVVDLGEERTTGLDVDIDGGVGEAVLRIPSGVGVRVDGDMGIGSFSAPGLKKRGGAYVNEAYGSSEATIDVRIDAGIGSIKIEVSGVGFASI